MKILYDGEIYTGQAAGGINRYYANIIKRLPKNFLPTLAVAATSQVNYPSHPNLKTFFYPRHGFRPGRLSYWLEKYYFRLVSSFKYDLAHPTYYWLLARHEMSQCRYPIVITIHDMIHELFPAEIDPSGFVVEAKRKAILSASAIICVSENTKKDLLNIYDIPENRVSVIYHASEIDITMAYGDEIIPTQPYFLYVGSRTGYKNFELLLKAFSKVISQSPDSCLCIAGAPFTKTELEKITHLGLNQHIKHFHYPTDHHLAKLYRCSLAFIYPSLYEGFGIPLLEAVACGAVVIASNASSIPEVLQDAGLLFDPFSVDELASRMLFLVDNPLKKEELVQAGFQRSRCFSWDNTVQQTIDIYQRVRAI